MNGSANPPVPPADTVREWVNALLQEPFLASEGCYRAQGGVVVQVIPVFRKPTAGQQQGNRHVGLRVHLAPRFMAGAVDQDEREADLAMLELAVQDLREGDYIQRLAACQKLGQLGLPDATTELRRVMESEQDLVVRDAAERALSDVAAPRFPASAFIEQAVTLRLAEGNATQRAETNQHGWAIFRGIPADALCYLFCVEERCLTLRATEAGAAIAEFAQREATPELRERLLSWAGLFKKLREYGQSVISAASDAVMPTEAELENWRQLVPWAFEELLARDEPSLFALQPAIRSRGEILVTGSRSRWRGGQGVGPAVAAAPILVEQVPSGSIEISIPSPTVGGGSGSTRMVLLMPIRSDLEPVLARLAWDPLRGGYFAALHGVIMTDYLFALEPPDHD